MLDRLRRLLRSPFALLAVIAPLTLLASDGASAQDIFSNFFEGIFGGPRHHRYQNYPPPSQWERSRVRRLVPHRDYGAPAYWHGQPSSSKKAKAKTPDTPTVEPSLYVAVIGDSLATMLADGLEEAYADKPEIRILHKTRDSSGLVRDDFHDWPKAIHDLLGSGERIDMAVVLIGSNDRQAIHEGNQANEPFSPRWREIYTARVNAIRSAFREKKIPLVWVGLPVMKNERFSADMAQLNEIYAQSSEKDGAVYVDLWEAFADERNQYQAFGPDVNGRIVKLRAGDGVHFTQEGARKVAHFVEGDIKHLLEARLPAGEPPAGAAVSNGRETEPPAAPALEFPSPGAPQEAVAPPLPERPAAGPIQSLTAPPIAADAELARRRSPARDQQAKSAKPPTLVDHVFVDGRNPTPQAGRSDDFSWPRNQASGAGAR